MRLPGTRIGARRLAPFSQSISRSPKKVSPEETWWFWNPNRLGVREAPEEFRKTLSDIDPNLRVTWSPVHERWLVWAKSNSINKLSPGWRLLFPVQNAQGGYQPLDERVLARLYSADGMQWGNARRYFDAVLREWERDRELAEKRREDSVKYSAGEYYDYMKIKNIGHGSKFANHFA